MSVFVKTRRTRRLHGTGEERCYWLAFRHWHCYREKNWWPKYTVAAYALTLSYPVRFISSFRYNNLATSLLHILMVWVQIDGTYNLTPVSTSKEHRLPVYHWATDRHSSLTHRNFTTAAPLTHHSTLIIRVNGWITNCFCNLMHAYNVRNFTETLHPKSVQFGAGQLANCV